MGTASNTASHLRAGAQRAYALGAWAGLCTQRHPSWPARVGIGRSDSGTWPVDAVSIRLRSIRTMYTPWPGVLMDAPWPVVALMTLSGSGMSSEAVIAWYCMGIPTVCIASPSHPTAAFCSVAVKINRRVGTSRADTACASSRATRSRLRRYLESRWHGAGQCRLGFAGDHLGCSRLGAIQGAAQP